jgi:hypothetical protein
MYMVLRAAGAAPARTVLWLSSSIMNRNDVRRRRDRGCIVEVPAKPVPISRWVFRSAVNCGCFTSIARPPASLRKFAVCSPLAKAVLRVSDVRFCDGHYR